MGVRDIFSTFGVEVVGNSSTVRRPLQTKAPAALAAVARDHGEAVLRLTLRIFAETHPGSAWALKGHLIGAVADVLASLPSVDEKILEKFDKIDLGDIDRRAGRMRGLVPRREACAVILLEMIDDGADQVELTKLEQDERTAVRVRDWISEAGVTGLGKYAAAVRAARALGIGDETVLDALDVDGLSPAAKACAHGLGLANSRTALLGAARHRLPEDQIAALEASAAKRKGRKSFDRIHESRSRMTAQIAA